MRVLTAEEVAALEFAADPLAEDHQLDPMQQPYSDIIRNGLAKYSQDEDWMYLNITPRGELALRVHRAYLESVGAGR